MIDGHSALVPAVPVLSDPPVEPSPKNIFVAGPGPKPIPFNKVTVASFTTYKSLEPRTKQVEQLVTPPWNFTLERIEFVAAVIVRVIVALTVIVPPPGPSPNEFTVVFAKRIGI